MCGQPMEISSEAYGRIRICVLVNKPEHVMDLKRVWGPIRLLA